MNLNEFKNKVSFIIDKSRINKGFCDTYHVDLFTHNILMTLKKSKYDGVCLSIEIKVQDNLTKAYYLRTLKLYRLCTNNELFENMKNEFKIECFELLNSIENERLM